MTGDGNPTEETRIQAYLPRREGRRLRALVVSASVSLPVTPSVEEVVMALRRRSGPGMPAAAILLSEMPAGEVLLFASEARVSEDELLAACDHVEREYCADASRLRRALHVA
jgi:hypothetical protein